MFKPKFVKHGELLVKGVQKFIRYKTDVMKEGRQAEIEVKLEELPIVQRRIVKKCVHLGRKVIVATHMLESMKGSRF